MKIDANVMLNSTLAETAGRSSLTVSVDEDYVESSYESVTDWVRNELEAMFGCNVNDNDFEVTNIDDIIDDISYEEYLSKVN